MNVNPEVLRKQFAEAFAFQKVFASEDGKTVLEVLKRFANYNSAMPTANTNELCVAEGRRQVVLQILHLLDIDLKEREQMITERMKDVESTDAV